MKTTLYLIAVLFSISALGQEKDRRAELEIQGRINEISISPDEKIWLTTATAKTFYTENIDSNWHYGKPIFEENEDEYSYSQPHLDRISFFNKDTAIISGYISVNNNDLVKNGYYLSTDAGKNWELLDYGGTSWIYTICTDKKGNAWMGGASKHLYYSGDFGKNWTTLEMPFKSSDRTYGIYMETSMSGIASSDHNEILKTENNWKTVNYLETPLDQEKYQPDSSMGFIDNRISKILIWKEYLVVSQKGHIFYSSKNKTEWKPFPIGIVDFKLDKDSEKLFAVTDSLKVITFSSPDQFQFLNKERLSFHPIDLKVRNGSLYTLSYKYGYRVDKVNQDGIKTSLPYTKDKKISEPQIIRKGKKLEWGANGNQIYLCEEGSDWYRENVLDFHISDFKLKNDSVAILWDGYRNNYLYSLHDHKSQKYTLEKPLKSFLKSPVIGFKIESGSRGCFHHNSDSLSYKKEGDSKFTNTLGFPSKYGDEGGLKFINKVSSSTLSDVLTTINTNPSTIPTIKDFHITKEDKENFVSMVDKRLNGESEEYPIRRKKINKEFYYSVPSRLDTLADDILFTILRPQVGFYSTTSNWFTIEIVNQNNDTLKISQIYYFSTPWNLPWIVQYDGLNFACYNVEFSQFINSCIPEDFRGKYIFDNSLLIMEIADFLWARED